VGYDAEYDALRHAKGELERAQTANAIDAQRPDLKQRIAYQLKDARANVARLEELQKLLEENPHTSRILELMGHG
jgi:ferritin-like metal-binding protein YciE